MSMLQNYQMHLTVPTGKAAKLLKFCYFILLVLLVSCGETKTKNTAETKQDLEQAKDTLVKNKATKTILCFGDSITAGYGLDDVNDAYTGVLQKRIDSLSLNYTVINSGVSGETTAGGKSRINWVIKQKPTIFLLELGANDGLRGVPLTETQSNLQAIINVVKEKSPETTIILAGMQLPPNMGQDYTTKFRAIFKDVATKNNIEFIPFILENVGGIASLNQRDGIHPNKDGHKIVANNVWEVLKPLL
ncbi:arylesterase [Hwangdonia lutea]|uniref:Arylesterase n=1 Tax=Hwangdonia lutea TaxID=3075823 RepID=A0AA97ENI0_9FLAO|nr:arylesterase [Hwangdonia sp. SCSIO 19198]WOD43300.1 arylesterase [Hwangdonia sp. SCSIO 19198]